MKILKRTLIIALCVSILSVSVGSKWFDLNHMEKVNATEAVTAVALSAAAMYAICYYVGTLAYMTAPIETAEIPDKQIAYTGYCTLRKAYIGASNPALANSPVLTFVDKAGQPYVYGSEALQEVAETEFKVILGGKMPGDDDNDDDNNEEEIDTTTDDKSGIVDNVVHMYGNVKELGAAVSIGFATMITKIFGEEYDKYINGEESVYTPSIEYNPVTSSDIELQSSGKIYTVSAFGHIGGSSDGCSICKNLSVEASHQYTSINGDVAGRYAFVYDTRYLMGFNAGYGYSVQLRNKDGVCYLPTTFTYSCGNSRDRGTSSIICDSFSANIPIFTTSDAATSYILTGEGYENSLNYEKSYRIGDWLQDDWSGELLDPYTGLNALGDMYNIARHQGLNALGNTINFSDFTDFIRDYFGELGTSNVPEFNPGLPIIEYPQVNDWKYEYHPTPGVPPVIDPVIDPVDPPVIDPVDPPVIDPVDPPVIDPEDIIEDIKPPIGNISDNLKYKFPFSIPWDIQYILTRLASTPKTPRFELPLVIKRYGINEILIIDLSNMEMLSTLSRTMLSILFMIGLINLTFKVVGMRKEE